SAGRGTPMAVEQVKVPRAGESISEVTLNRWLKPDRSYVKVDEPVVELGTDKATQEVAAPTAGVLKHLVKEGATVPVDAVIAQIDTAAKAPAEAAKAKPTAPASADGARGESLPPAAATGIPSPAAARVLAEAGLSPSQVKGSGPDGRITKEDALRVQESGDRKQETATRPANGPVPTLPPVSRPLT